MARFNPAYDPIGSPTTIPTTSRGLTMKSPHIKTAVELMKMAVTQLELAINEDDAPAGTLEPEMHKLYVTANYLKTLND